MKTAKDNPDFDKLRYTIDYEGFDYTFMHYSKFKEIEDVEFHKLRTAFITAREKLAKYLGIEDE